MSIFDVIAVLIVLSALFSYLNYRFLHLPTTIGLMVLSLLLSLGVVIVGRVLPSVSAGAQAMLEHVDFGETVLHGMLGLLLFAGALHVDIGELNEQRLAISVLALVGTILSTVVTGFCLWWLLGLLGLDLKLIYCLLFGALIAPTDPIAVLAILRGLPVPKPLALKIAGESLFNDGVGVVIFLGLLEFATGPDGAGLDLLRLVKLFLVEAVGGAALGLALGYVAFRMLKSVDNYQVEILISLALVTGGYALADRLHTSGPIAMVAAGLLIGNHGRAFAMSVTTREHLDLFWELIDEILNAVLFVLIGLEVLVLTVTGRALVAGMVAVGVVLAARWISVAASVGALRRVSTFEPHTVKILTWSGLRGGISVALALSLKETLQSKPGAPHEIILVMTYIVVLCSILLQGLTIGPLIRRWYPSTAAQADSGRH